MRENGLSPLPSSPTAYPEQPIVLSEFQVAGDQFLVIRLEINSGEQSVLNKFNRLIEGCVELERFNVQGQLCAIVKVEQSSCPVEEADITTFLTERELQIATLVASGQANKQIAKQLRISEWTVSAHLRRIFIKLDVDSRAAMVYRCAPIIQSLFGRSKARTTTLSGDQIIL